MFILCGGHVSRYFAEKIIVTLLMIIEIGTQCVANYSLVPGAPPVAYISKGG